MPSPAAPPSGCRFHTRCWLREQLGNPENCTTIDPDFRDIGGGHLVACHWAEKVPTSVVASAVPTAEETAVVAGPTSRRTPGGRHGRCRASDGGIDDERHLSIMPGSAGTRSDRNDRLGGDPSAGQHEGGERRA